MDNFNVLTGNVEIKIFLKMAGYKMNLPFSAGFLGWKLAPDFKKYYNIIDYIEGKSSYPL